METYSGMISIQIPYQLKKGAKLRSTLMQKGAR